MGMKTGPVVPADLRGVFAVPPLARAPDARRSIDLAQNRAMIERLKQGGLTRFIYGGNAFLHHVGLEDYEILLDWLAGFDGGLWPIPSLGPAYGLGLAQARLLRRHGFSCVMALPSNDPRDAAGLERGLRELAEAAGMPLMLYLKSEDSFGADRDAGLAAVARLMDSGVGVAIKYAVVRPDPAKDPYLESLLKRVDRARVISGIGERPAVVHLRGAGLPGFTTGSGCVAPGLSRALFEACARGDADRAESIRRAFLPLEDLRDAWGPARVLHAAVDRAGAARTGPFLPFVSEPTPEQLDRIEAAAAALARADGAPDGRSA